MKKILTIMTIILCFVLITNVVYAVNEITAEYETVNSSTSNTQNTVSEDKQNQTLVNTNNKENKQQDNTTEINSATSKIVEMKNNEKQTLEDYKEAYGSDSYGLTAYILSRIQIYSIPFCFLGIAISAIYQYVLGVRKLDTRDKGFTIMISIITLFVIAQVLPLIFAVVVKGWRG